MNLRENICLKTYTTIGSGGCARYLAEVKSPETLAKVFSFCFTNKIPFVVLGKGSNTIFDDKGFNGVVILNKMQKIFWDHLKVKVESGYSFAHLGIITAKKNAGGLEFAAGIPASVGGAIYMNAGASGQQTQDCLEKVTFMHENGVVEQFLKKDCGFGYRRSIFQTLKGCIVSAEFVLKNCCEAREKQLVIIHHRTKSQPYSDKSAGCFFKNPEMKPAGALIEEVGLKGYAIGGASVSVLHGNFIINQNGASTQDLFDLASYVQDQVFKKKGIQLELEVRKIPFEGDS
jgi:UDP-N-acetylmuramate dehydrogenase